MQVRLNLYLVLMIQILVDHRMIMMGFITQNLLLVTNLYHKLVNPEAQVFLGRDKIQMRNLILLLIL